MRGLSSLLADRLAIDPSGPLVTHYDDATGERVELSATSLDNWVAKTCGMLVDGLGVGPGDRIGVLLPLHWQTVVALLACWKVGAVTVLGESGSDGDDLDVAFVDTAHVASVQADEVVCLSLLPMGRGLEVCPPTVTDYAAEIRSFGDHFTGPLVDPDDPALEIEGRLLSGAAGAELVSGESGRVLTTLDPTTSSGLRAVIGPIASGGSVVTCLHLDQSRLEARVTAERVNAVHLPPV